MILVVCWCAGVLVCCHQWQLPLNSSTVHARRCTIGAFSPLLQRANVDPANIILCSGPALDPFWFVTDHGTPQLSASELLPGVLAPSKALC